MHQLFSSSSIGWIISRFSGIAVMVLFWIWLGWTQSILWEQAPTFSSVFIAVGGVATILVCMPWSCLPMGWWKRLFALWCLVALALAVVLIGQVSYSQAFMLDLGQKAKPPMLQGAFLFIYLLQLPTVFFQRYEHAFEA